MKTIFNKASALLFVTLVASASMATAQVYYSVRVLLSEQFATSKKVDFIRVRPSAAQKVSLKKKLGYSLAKSEYIFYVARNEDGHVDGYAIFDQEIGQHELIDFATFFDAKGKVSRVEVVAYREPYGEGIRSKRFRKQFVGRSAKSGFRTGRDIDSITGATLSARAMSKAVRRASVILDQAVLQTVVPSVVNDQPSALQASPQASK